MSFGQRVTRSKKERTIEVHAAHLMEHFRAFLLAGGLIARDEVLYYTNLPTYIEVKLKKVKTKKDD